MGLKGGNLRQIQAIKVHSATCMQGRSGELGRYGTQTTPPAVVMERPDCLQPYVNVCWELNATNNVHESLPPRVHVQPAAGNQTSVTQLPCRSSLCCKSCACHVGHKHAKRKRCKSFKFLAPGANETPPRPAASERASAVKWPPQFYLVNITRQTQKQVGLSHSRNPNQILCTECFRWPNAVSAR